MIDVFISYAREDEEIARELFDTIESQGFRPWLDKVNLLPGQDWEKVLTDAVKQSDAQIFICSPRSVGKRGFFQREIRLALDVAEALLESDISIIPYIAEACEVPDSLSKYQWLEHTDQDANQKLIKSLALAAEQRGYFKDTAESIPAIVDFEKAEKDETARGFVSSYAYPVVKIPNNEFLTKSVNAVIQGSIFESLSQFRNQTIDDERAIERGINNEYHVDVAAEYVGEAATCLVSATWWYSGGAHGNSFRNSLCIDIRDASIFSAASLFVSQSLIESFLWEKIEEEGEPPLLEKSDSEQSISDCLSHKSYITPKGLFMLFDPYEVFCYAHGHFDIFLPNSHPAFDEQNLTELGRRLTQEVF